MARSVIFVCFSILYIICNADPALAKKTGKNDTKQKTAAAKFHFKQGQKYYKLSDYKRALHEYRTAYKILSRPGFLFNMGLCLQKMKKNEEAIFHLESYLRDKPKARNKEQVLQMIQSMRTGEAKPLTKKAQRKKIETAEIPLVAIIPPKPKPASKEKKNTKKLNSTKTDMTPIPKPPELASESTFNDSTPWYKTWWFWTIVGSAAATGAGVTTWAVLSNQEKIVLPAGGAGTLDRR